MGIDADFFLVQGDHGEAVQMVLEVAGEPLDLTDVASLTLLGRHTRLRRVRFETACTVVQPTVVDGVPTGRADYLVDAGDTLESGIFEVQLRIVYKNGRRYTVPNKGYKQLEVTPALQWPLKAVDAAPLTLIWDVA